MSKSSWGLLGRPHPVSYPYQDAGRPEGSCGCLTSRLPLGSFSGSASVADPAIWPATDRVAAPLPIDQKLGLVMAARVRHGGKFSLKSSTFCHFLYKNVQKAFSYPHQGLCQLELARWELRPRPPFRLALRALAMPPLAWQIRHCSANSTACLAVALSRSSTL